MPSTLASKLKEDFLEALKLELETARRISASERTNQLKNGTRRYQHGDSWIYEFDSLSGFPPEEGAQITFTISDKSHKGKFLGENEGKFLFEIDEDLGAKIPNGVVTSDPLFLLEKQISFLQSDTPFENNLALSVLGYSDFPKVETLETNDEFVKNLNQLQATALKVSTENSVTYIWGPPGTGKTTTMGSVVAALAEAGQKVLLVSNTNLALDTALERCIDMYEDVKEIPAGEMLRIGVIVKPELKSKYENKVDFDLVIENLSGPFRIEIQNTTNELQQVQNELDVMKSLWETRNKYENLALGPDKAKLDHESCILKIEDLKVQLSAKKLLKAELDEELKSSQAISGLKRLFSNARKPFDIEREILANQKSIESLQKQISDFEVSASKLLRKIEEAQAGQTEALAWLEANPLQGGTRERFQELENKVVNLRNNIDKCQKEIASLRDDVLQQSRVLACTAYRPMLDKAISEMSFDCVVVDEASMLQLPLFYTIASVAKSRIIVAGDFRQLQPIVRIGSRSSASNLSQNNENEMKELLSSNAFTKSGILSNPNAVQLVALRDQYRMRTEISDLISSTFYPERTLQTMNDQRNKPTPWGNHTFIWIDTSDLEPESSTVDGKSRRNITHALVAQQVIEKLLVDGWKFSSTSEKSFAVITPYAKQSSLIENLAFHGTEQGSRGGISTVHRFQGNERDLIVIDLTKVSSSAEPMLGSFVGHPDELAIENAMWNVAISRARQHVIVIADSNTLKINQTSLISKLVGKMTSTGKVIPGSEILNKDLITQAMNQTSHGGLSWFSGDGFYAAFQKDLENAQEKLFLASPFSTPEGTARWMETFEYLKVRGVEIVASTKPVYEKGDGTEAEKTHSSLNTVFKELRLVPRMHEKIAVIDERIVWLGSLNILSHKNSSEIMIRIESKEFAASILKEYLSRRMPNREKTSPRSTQKRVIGEPCPERVCGGHIVLKPGGISKKGYPYSAFFGCSKFPRCSWSEELD